MTTRDRPRRDCQCKRARHQHGTRTAYVVDRCRCDDCREAARIYEQKRRRAHLYGRYDNLVDATPAREHLTRLLDQGMSYKQLQTLTGVDRSTLCRIVHGRAERGEGPARRIIPVNAERILAVRYTHRGLPGGHRIPATGVTRRAQALMCLGYSLKWQAAQIGMNPGNYNRMVNGGTGGVTVALHQRVDGMYRDLENTPNPATDWHDLAAANRSRYTAARRGYVPPAGWDCIDTDPTPATVTDITTAADRKAQDAVDLIAGGMAPAQVMDRLRVGSLAALTRLLAGAGREDLAVEAEHAHQIWKDAA